MACLSAQPAAAATPAPVIAPNDGQSLLAAARKSQRALASYATESSTILRTGSKMTITKIVQNLPDGEQRQRISYHFSNSPKAKVNLEMDRTIIRDGEGQWHLLKGIAIKIPRKGDDVAGETLELMERANPNNRAVPPTYAIKEATWQGKECYEVTQTEAAEEIAFRLKIANDLITQRYGAALKTFDAKANVPATKIYDIDRQTLFIVRERSIAVAGNTIRDTSLDSFRFNIPDVETLVSVPASYTLLFPQTEAEYNELISLHASDERTKTKPKQ